MIFCHGMQFGKCLRLAYGFSSFFCMSGHFYHLIDSMLCNDTSVSVQL